jgi:hypothetical protein
MPPSNHDYDGLMSEGTDAFSDWYFEERGTKGGVEDEDPDTVIEDTDFDDIDLY